MKRSCHSSAPRNLVGPRLALGVEIFNHLKIQGDEILRVAPHDSRLIQLQDVVVTLVEAPRHLATGSHRLPIVKRYQFSDFLHTCSFMVQKRKNRLKGGLRGRSCAG
jgi:hypothetical protein